PQQSQLVQDPSSLLRPFEESLSEGGFPPGSLGRPNFNGGRPENCSFISIVQFGKISEIIRKCQTFRGAVEHSTESSAYVWNIVCGNLGSRATEGGKDRLSPARPPGDDMLGSDSNGIGTD